MEMIRCWECGYLFNEMLPACPRCGCDNRIKGLDRLPTLEELHDCQKSHGKMVCIEIDHTGNTYCGYCGERVDYSLLYRRRILSTRVSDNRIEVSGGEKHESV